MERGGMNMMIISNEVMHGSLDEMATEVLGSLWFTHTSAPYQEYSSAHRA
jgi:hypothetical protein